MINTFQQLVNEERWVEIVNIVENSQFDRSKIEIILAAYKAYTKLASPEQAEYWLDQALSVTTKNHTLYRDKGLFHYKRRSLKEAEFCFIEASKLRPDRASYHAYLGYISYQLGDYNNSIESYIKALTIDNTQHSWWLNLGYAQMKLGLLYEAAESLQKSLMLRDNKTIRNMYEELLRQPRLGNVSASVKYYDTMFMDSPEYAKSGDSCVYTPIWQCIVDILKDKGTNSILDLGCGPGQFAEFIKLRLPNIQYTGVDFSSVAILQAQNRCPNYLFKQEKLPITNFSNIPPFDTIICTEVLEHVEHDLTILEAIPAGTFIVASVPNFNSFGHIRLFRTAEEVYQRYGSLIENIQVQANSVNQHSIIWLMYGHKTVQNK